MKKRILVLLALIMSVLFVSCGSSGDNVKDALNDTGIFSQEEINYVNSVIEEMKQYGYNVTSKTVNSSTMQISGTYTYEDEDTGNDVTGSFSTKLEKKNGLVYETFTDYLDPDDSYVEFELTIPRLFDTFTSNDFFTKEQSDGFSKLLSDNGLSGFGTGSYLFEQDGLAYQLKVSVGFSPNISYEGTIGKYNNKYHLFDETGIIASENTLEALIANTNVKTKLQTELSKVLLGTYSGTYSGGDSGTWNITINSDFSITGTTYSGVADKTYTLTGTLTGNTATLTATSGATLTATLYTHGPVFGTWVNEEFDISGNLSGNKQ